MNILIHMTPHHLPVLNCTSIQHNLACMLKRDAKCNWIERFTYGNGTMEVTVMYFIYIFRYPIVHRWKVQQTKVYSRNMRVYNTKSFLHRFVVRCKLHSSFSFGPVADCDYKLINTRLQTWIHVNVKGRGMRNITIPNELICTVS